LSTQARAAETNSREGRPVPAIIRPSTEFCGKAIGGEPIDSGRMAGVLDVARYKPTAKLGLRIIRR